MSILDKLLHGRGSGYSEPQLLCNFVGTTAAIVAASIAAGGSIASGVIGSKAAKDSAETIAKGQQQAADTITDITGQAVKTGQEDITAATNYLQDQGDDIAGLYDPFVEGVPGDIKNLRDLSAPGGELSQQFSFTGKDLEKEPGYMETLRRGQEAIERASAAQGGLFGTNTLKKLADYSAGTANTTFNDAFSRAATTFKLNREGALSRADTLKSLASLGLSGTSGKAGAKGETTTQVNRNLLERATLGVRGAEAIARAQGGAAEGAADATAAGQVGGANSWLKALKGGTDALQDFLAKRNFGGAKTPPFNDAEELFGTP